MKKKQISSATFLRILLSHVTEEGSEHLNKDAETWNIPVEHICNTQFHECQKQPACSSYFTKLDLPISSTEMMGLFQ